MPFLSRRDLLKLFCEYPKYFRTDETPREYAMPGGTAKNISAAPTEAAF
jgi:hypothetical protein